MSKEKILTAIRENKPKHSSLPEIPLFEQKEIDLLESFKKIVEAGGGKVVLIPEGDTLKQVITQEFPNPTSIVSLISEMIGTIDLTKIKKALDLKKVDLAILNGQLGVAENGAVWVTENDCGYRVLPFITQHLMIILSKQDLVWNMHQAYQKIQVDETGFGVFIAGPSKTADIEQSLVIGAQGARSFTVILK